MDLMEVIRKAAAGETLGEPERAMLTAFRPENGGELQKRNRELEARLEELENRALTEPEQLKRKFDSELARLQESLKITGTERDAAREELTKLHFRNRIDRIAQEEGFSDPDYLEYLCSTNRVAVEQTETVREFMTGLRESSPRFFKLELAPGAPVPAPVPEKVPAAGNDLARLLAEVPAVNE